MKKRIVSFFCAAALALTGVFSLSACSPAASFLDKKIDISSFTEKINSSFLSIGQALQSDKLTLTANTQLTDSGDRTTDASVGISSDKTTGFSSVDIKTAIDQNPIGLSFIQDDSTYFVVSDVLDKPVKVPVSLLVDGFTENTDKVTFNTFFEDLYKAMKASFSSSKIASEKTSYKVNSVDQAATKMTATVTKDEVIAFLKALQPTAEKYANSGLCEYILQYIASLNVLPSAVSVSSYAALITSLEAADFNILWTKTTRLNKLVEEEATISFGKDGSEGSVTLYFTEKGAEAYSTGTIELYATDSSSTKTSLLKLNYTDDDGTVKVTIAIYNLLTVTIKNEDTSTDGNKTSASTITFTVTQSNKEYDLTITSKETVNESSSSKASVTAEGTITSTALNLSFNFKGEVTAESKNEISFASYKDENCYVITNDQNGVDVYLKFVNALTEKYPSLNGLLPTDLSMDEHFANTEYVANLNGVDVSVSPYLYKLQFNRDYYEQSFAYYQSGSDFATLLKTYEIDGQILSAYITAKSKDDFLISRLMSQKFEELGLQLSFKDIFAIASSVESQYSSSVYDYLLQNYGLTKANVRYLFADYYKQEMIKDYYFGENGTQKLTDEDLQATYLNDYTGMRYILLYTTDDSGTALSEEEISSIKAKADEAYKKLTSGEITMEDAIINYSDECYTEDELNSLVANYPDYADEITQRNEVQKKGFTINKSGASPIDGYNFPVSVADAVFALDINAYTLVQNEYGYFIVQKLANTNSFDEMSATIKTSAITDATEKLFQSWKDAAVCTYYDDIIAKYDINNMSTLFSAS